jgi:cell division cycle protein 37
MVVIYLIYCSYAANTDGNKMAKANLRIKEINKILSKASAADGDVSDSDDDLEDLDGLRSELKALQNSNRDNQAKLDHYERNKKWNVDNMCHVTEERTIVNKNVSENKFSETGFALPKDEDSVVADEAETSEVLEVQAPNESEDVSKSTAKMSAAKIGDAIPKETLTPKEHTDSAPAVAKTKAMKPPLLHPQPNDPIKSVSVSMLSYHQFTQKYADVVEQFMSMESMDKSKEFLLQHGDVLLQENASNYLLLASLEDEMNGYHDKMKLVARQSQIISNIAELAKSLKLHPGNVIHPFFQRMTDKELFDGFMVGVKEFVQRIQLRAVQKKKEMDEERAREIKEKGGEAEDVVELSDIPREKRLGPGGLDPLEVFESLPESMQEAFESREKEKLEAALRAMTPDEAEYHMQRCIDSGLWNS